MFLSKSEGKKFEPAPAGVKPCLVIDYIDLGMVETEWKGVKKMKPMLRLVWQTPDKIPGSDLSFNVSQRYTVSSHEKANLRRDIPLILGHKIDWNSDGKFDLESLVGNACYLNITHSEPKEDGKVWANIDSIMPLPDGQPIPEANPNYVRVKDREQDDKATRDRWATDTTADADLPSF